MFQPKPFAPCPVASRTYWEGLFEARTVNVRSGRAPGCVVSGWPRLATGYLSSEGPAFAVSMCTENVSRVGCMWRVSTDWVTRHVLSGDCKRQKKKEFECSVCEACSVETR